MNSQEKHIAWFLRFDINSSYFSSICSLCLEKDPSASSSSMTSNVAFWSKRKTSNEDSQSLTLSDVTNIVIDRRKNIVPPRAKKRRRIILLNEMKHFSHYFLVLMNKWTYEYLWKINIKINAKPMMIIIHSLAINAQAKFIPNDFHVFLQSKNFNYLTNMRNIIQKKIG